MALSDWRSY